MSLFRDKIIFENSNPFGRSSEELKKRHEELNKQTKKEMEVDDKNTPEGEKPASLKALETSDKSYIAGHETLESTNITTSFKQKIIQENSDRNRNLRNIGLGVGGGMIGGALLANYANGDDASEPQDHVEQTNQPTQVAQTTNIQPKTVENTNIENDDNGLSASTKLGLGLTGAAAIGALANSKSVGDVVRNSSLYNKIGADKVTPLNVKNMTGIRNVDSYSKAKQREVNSSQQNNKFSNTVRRYKKATK